MKTSRHVFESQTPKHPTNSSAGYAVSSSSSGIDALLPPEMALRAEYLGMRKAHAPLFNLVGLSVLAGAFIAMGGVFATTVSAGISTGLPYGVARLLVGLVFCTGLVMIIIGGAELFTGNTLIVMAWASRKVSLHSMIRNWAIVYLGNFIGAVGSAILVFWSGQHRFGSGSIGQSALSIAASKTHYSFSQAVVLGILCNALVCMAVWLSYSARSTIDKIAAVLLPITAFVAAGFEHSVANMYFIPFGLLVKDFDPIFAAKTGLDLSELSWSSFILGNLIPVTLGNVIGGVFLVAATYWMIYLRPRQEAN